MILKGNKNKIFRNGLTSNNRLSSARHYANEVLKSIFRNSLSNTREKTKPVMQVVPEKQMDEYCNNFKLKPFKFSGKEKCL